MAEFQATFVPEAEEDEVGPAAETVTVDGRAMRYARVGEGGVAVVLVHGFGGDLTTWLFNQDAIATPGRSVYVPDLPGHGGSSKDVGSGRLDELADAVQGTLDTPRHRACSPRRPFARRCDRSNDRGARRTARGVADTRCSGGLGQDINGEFLDGFVEAESRRELKPVLETLFSDPAVVTREFVEEVLRTKRIDGVSEALRAISSSCFPDGRQAISIGDGLAALDAPILAIWGAEDRVVPPPTRRRCRRGRRSRSWPARATCRRWRPLTR